MNLHVTKMQTNTPSFTIILIMFTAWVPNVFETIGHYPIDDSEMSHCTSYIYALYRVKFYDLPVSFIFKAEILNSGSGECLSSPPAGKNF